MPFCHLHVHSEYSLLDGACRIGPLVDRAKELGMTHLAITDHGVMYGVVDFYKACKAKGITPIIGCEVYVAPGDRREKTSAQREYAHLVLLCENETGYKNLIKLSSIGFTEGFYYKPRIDYETLAKHSEGLIALSACLSGDIPKALADGRYDTARTLALKLSQMMGEGRFYLELQENGISEQRIVNRELVKLAQDTGLPLVATNDVHYLRKEDARAQEVLMCVQTGKTMDDPSHMTLSSDTFYLRSEDEMRELFKYAPEAIDNTAAIAERCKVDFDFNTLHLPEFKTPEGEEPEAMFRRLCMEGLKARVPDYTQEYVDRLNYEMNMIASMGYVAYFLIVWDFIKYAKDNGIPVGPGRGSGAGSLVAYSLSITGVDPIKYELIFERFLNPDRVSMPDIDIDFCYERRQEVIDYVARRYGSDHVCQIITFGTMAARGVIRDVGRALGFSYGEVDPIAKMIPFALNMTLENALSVSPQLREAYEDSRVRDLIDTAKALEGMPRHASTHAAGVLITAKPVTEYVPVQANDEVITTQFPMKIVEGLGLLKMDFLGLRTLTVLRDTMVQLGVPESGVAAALDALPLDDQDVYATLGTGDTDGIFQLESGGMRRVLMELKPHDIKEITAVISLYRPGPMESIPKYIAGKRDPSSVTYLHPTIEPILSKTYGCMVYQEDVIRIVRELAGYSMARSDLVRRAMSKKQRDVMAKEREYFIHGMLNDNGEVIVKGAVRSGMPEQVAVQLFDEMTAFSEYAFPKAHAAAYAMVAYQSAYLKLHHPKEFMAAFMNSLQGNTDRIAAHIQSLRKMGVATLPPHVNKSQAKFSVEEEGIRYGLSGIKNLGVAAVKHIVRERRQKPFTSLFDLCRRVGEALGKRGVESLIKAGALDGLGATRGQMAEAFERLMDGAAAERKRSVEGQLSLFGEGALISDEPPPLGNAPDYTPRYALQLEKEMTGVYLSGHPLDEHRHLLDKLDVHIGLLREMAEEEDAMQKFDNLPVHLGGIITASRRKLTRKNAMMAFITIEDLYGSMEALIFPKAVEQTPELLNVDTAVVLHGRFSLREDEEPKIVVEAVSALTEEGLKPPTSWKSQRNNNGNSQYGGDHHSGPTFDDLSLYETAALADPQALVGNSGSVTAACVCPVCGSPLVQSKKGGFGCARFRDGCPFVVPRDALVPLGGPAIDATLLSRVLSQRYAQVSGGTVHLAEHGLDFTPF